MGQLSAEAVDSRYRMYQLLAYSSIVYGVVAVMAVCIALPMAARHVTHATVNLKQQVLYCQTAASEVAAQLHQINNDLTAQNRTKRQGNYGYGGNGYGNAAQVRPAPSVQAQGSCDGCCLPGIAGPPGPAGNPGKPGRNGAHGKAGLPGKSPEPTCDVVTPPPCDCPRGPQGPPGPDGTPGETGDPGAPGRAGQAGPPGRPGPKGPPGPNGQEGDNGVRGDPGQPAPGGVLRPGPPGEPGDAGPNGPPGVPGKPGPNGADGPPGAKGTKGPPGNPGEVGRPGSPGQPGNPGDAGEPGICPKYCALDGGVFFSDGTKLVLKS